jgi:uncharacterized protein involved in response to NO
MTLAVMTRVSLGHTGRALVADGWTQTIYLLVIIAALVRVAAAMATGFAVPLLYLAGALWISAYWVLALSYGPLLSQPRHNAR